MKYNFDKIIKIKNTNSVKYDSAKKYGMPDGLFPMWLADMDFKVMPELTKALEKSARHAVFGYTTTNQEYFEPIQKWFASNFNFDIKFDWLVNTPGVVFAITMTIRALTKSRDAIIIQTPVYAPFSNVIENNNRKLITNSLIYKNGKYTIDFKDFENKIVKNKVKMFILCSPHNPIGKIWRKEDLIKLGTLCLKHKVIIVADEIHCDFAYKGYKHIVFASLKKDFLMNTVMCTSGGKTFNFAGLQIANIFIANKNFKEKVILEIARTGYDGLSKSGVVACQTAYKYGDKWLKEVKDYIYNNLSYIRNFLKTNIPKLKLVDPEGTYLIWIDCTELGINEKHLKDILENKAKLWVAMGSSFGVEGTNFIRIAIATPLINIKTAFNKLFKALKSEKLI
ncbi:MAG: pyridoxal phosphate-dependent aminotransferase [Endomicrobium sp.]|jgi:cystathionine beta-lyase|nr:pyridoxal phosphate-dependent aminotransferase [Endomicrobium sp.]